jgi:hypothetical protein
VLSARLRSSEERTSEAPALEVGGTSRRGVAGDVARHVLAHRGLLVLEGIQRRAPALGRREAEEQVLPEELLPRVRHARYVSDALVKPQ